MIREVNHPRAGKLNVVGTPMKFSRTPCTIDKPSPELGKQTEEVLRDELGLSEEEIKKLKESKVI
jgi:formyl-CoA transferase